MEICSDSISRDLQWPNWNCVVQNRIKICRIRRLIMARIPYASWRAKAQGMSHRHDNSNKLPGLVSCQQLLTKRDLQWLVRDVVRFMSFRPKAYRMCHRHRNIMKQVIWGVSGKFWIDAVFKRLIMDTIRYPQERAKTLRMSYRHGKHHKTPDLVFWQNEISVNRSGQNSVRLLRG